MVTNRLIDSLNKYSLSILAVLLVLASYVLLWKNQPHTPVNFVVGDAGDYYSYLISIFINHNLENQSATDWYILKAGSGTINVHPIGESILLIPFFFVGYVLAFCMGSPLSGVSAPFQASLSLAAIVYVLVGLYFLKKLLIVNGHSVKTSLLIITLVLFGTNVFNYTIFEAAMSHVYSFALISLFLFFSHQYVANLSTKNLYLSFLTLGIITLVRPNNVLILFSVFFWMKNWEHFKQVALKTFQSKHFYLAVVLTLSIAAIQNAVWFYQSHQWFHQTYKADGFYWTNPQIFKMLFGFDNGFFIYTPLCFVFLLGFILLYKRQRFAFWSGIIFLSGLVYFFASYWAYTYFDGLGIRVLVDYYALFAIIGAKVTDAILNSKLATVSTSPLIIFLVIVNLVYCYQNNRSIILRSGMNFEQWKYTFLKIGKKYHGCLGGANDLTPYSKNHPQAFLTKQYNLPQAYDYSGNEFGLALETDSLGVTSNRLHFEIELEREELKRNASKDAVLCLSVLDKTKSESHLNYLIKLNETPSYNESCTQRTYTYHVNVGGSFLQNDKLSVYIWNRSKKAFRIHKFQYKLFNYNYKVNT